MFKLDKCIDNNGLDWLEEIESHYSNPQNVEADAGWCAKRKAEREKGGETNVYTTDNRRSDSIYTIVDSVISLTDIRSKGRA